jgi:O-antigen/teichoic acid export membrane protein
MSVARHTLYNLAGASVPVAVSLVTVPLYLSIIGLDRYGVLAICWLLLGYFNLFDFGLGRATAQKIATLAAAPAEDRSRTFWTTLTLSVLLSIGAMALFAPAASIGLGLMNLESEQIRSEFDNSLPWLVAALPFGVVNSLLLGALEGRREFLKLNLVTSIGTALTALLPLAAAILFGPNLPHLLAASLAARALVVAVLFATCVAAIPVLAPARPARGEMRQLLGFGGWTTVSNVIGPLLVFWDRFAIGAVISSAAVALYVVPFNLVNQLQVLPSALSSALFPRFAEAGAEKARSMSREGIEILAFILTPLTLGLLTVAGPFLHLWLGPTTGAAAAPVACILLFGFWSNGLARIAAAELQALGRPRVLATVHLAELVPYALLLYVSMRWFGIAGAAFAWSARCAVDTVILYGCVGARWRSYAPLIPQALLIGASVPVAFLLPLWSPARWAILGLATAVGAALVLRRPPERLLALLPRLRRQSAP